MKKKIIAIAILIGVVGIAILLLMINNSMANKEDKTTVNKGSKWDAQEYVDGKDKNSTIKKTTSIIDTNPSSITVLVNKEHKIPSDYKPEDLVEPNIKFSFNYDDEKRLLRAEAAKQLELLFEGAKHFGHELLGVSGYRSYERQKTIYEFNLLKYGYEYTQQYSAMPGTSEHQTGLAIDISCKSMDGLLRTSFADTKEGKWVQENAYKYGYIVRYKKDKTSVTGYGYEPWHIRYVGYDLAKFLYDNNMTLDEYYEYKLSKDAVDREQYAYYDDLLSQKNKGNIEFSQAVLDDLLDQEDVVSDEELEEPELPEDPADILDEFDSTEAPTEEEVIMPSEGATLKPTLEATLRPTSDVKPTPESTKKPEPTKEPTKKPEPTKEPTNEPSDGGSSNPGGGPEHEGTPKPGGGFLWFD